MTFLLIAAAVTVPLVVPGEVALAALGIALVIWQPWLLLVFGALALVGGLLCGLGALGMNRWHDDGDFVAHRPRWICWRYLLARADLATPPLDAQRAAAGAKAWS
ncbi:MAG TPA: hypothetical protein VMY76_07540 [Gemmatimonadales bacterium]|nr:hypothetical protein [Gemmatimonadales bacterium]